MMQSDIKRIAVLLEAKHRVAWLKWRPRKLDARGHVLTALPAPGLGPESRVEVAVCVCV